MYVCVDYSHNFNNPTRCLVSKKWNFSYVLMYKCNALLSLQKSACFYTNKLSVLYFTMAEKLNFKEKRHDRLKSVHYSYQENDPVNQGSTFRNAWKKMKTLAPFLWPRKDIFLQFRVIFCFVLLVAGRVINLYVPIFSKMIGMLKHCVICTVDAIKDHEL